MVVAGISLQREVKWSGEPSYTSKTRPRGIQHSNETVSVGRGIQRLVSTPWGGCYSGIKSKLHEWKVPIPDGVLFWPQTQTFSVLREKFQSQGREYYSEPSCITGCYTWFWPKNSGSLACPCIADRLSHTVCVETNKVTRVKTRERILLFLKLNATSILFLGTLNAEICTTGSIPSQIFSKGFILWIARSFKMNLHQDVKNAAWALACQRCNIWVKQKHSLAKSFL